ncbi:MAG: chemotaxis protein CheW [Candidatus Sumerlaeia bacterium]
MDMHEKRREFAQKALETIEKLAGELISLDNNTADLAALVAIVEYYSTLKDLAEKSGENTSFQICFGSEETLSSVLCDRFDDPAPAIMAVKDAMGVLKEYMEGIADGKENAEACQPKIQKLFELLEVPVVQLEKTNVVDALFGEAENESPVEEAPKPESPEAPVEAIVETPLPIPEPEPAPTAPPQTAPKPAAAQPEVMEVTNGLPEDLEDVDLYKEFVFECSEHLETIEEKILDLEDNPTDIDLINEIFRPIHSMKGGAGFLSLTGMNKLAHITETLLDRCRKQTIPVTPQLVELCLRSVDCLKQMIANLTQVTESSTPQNESAPDIVIGPVMRDIQALLDNPEGSPAPAPAQAAPAVAASAAPSANAAGGAAIPAAVAAPTQAPVMSNDPKEEDGDLNDPNWASTGLPETFGDPDDIELFRRFLLQCNEHLETVESKILSLENNPEDEELINEIFRAMHSIKGDSSFLSLDVIGKLAHDTETILDRCRKKTIPCSGRVIELCLQSADLLKRMVNNLAEALEQEKPEEFKTDPVVYGHVLKAINTFLNSPSGRGEAPPPSTRPPRLGDVLIQEGSLTEADLEEALALQEMPLGEILVKTGKASADQVEKALSKQKEAGGAGAGGVAARAIKVDTEKIDLLVNLVGELVIIEAQVAQMAATAQVGNGNGSTQIWEKNVSQLGKITKELQDRSMSLRMMPIKQTFQKMTRLVRDASHKMNKKVNLVLSGEDTELDKTVVEQIGDPLVHMLRNSVDHGIESPEDRVAAGKPETGTVNLEAYYEGDRILIRVRDDGKGLDKEVLLNKAIENGLIREGENLSDEQIYNLIFAAGFSTAKEVTDISGRGVGMDVVKRNIEKLRGHIITESEKGKGTTITVSLPLTLAIIDGMVVRVGKEEFIIPTVSIQESVRPEKKDISTVTGRGEMINVRGNLVPLIRLYRTWNIEPKTEDPCDSLVVIVENKGLRGCLMVDELVGQQQIVIKNLGEQFGEVRGIAGATILGSGRVGLILDVDGILDKAING